MKILEVTYLSINSDPRAKKFADTLSQTNDVTVLDLGDSKVLPGYKVVSKKKLKNPIMSIFVFWLSIFKNAVRIKPDVIIAHNYYNVFPVWIISLLVGAKRVYDSYEIYIPSRTQKLNKRSYFFYLLEKVSITHYPVIFSANMERSRLMKAKFNLKRLPIPVLNISNSINASDLSKEDLNNKYPDLKGFLDNGKIIVYQGYMSIGRDIDKYLDILKLLPDSFKLLYIGDGPDLQLIRNKITELNISDRALALGRVQMNDVVPFVRNCSYGLVTYHFKDYNNRYCSPNKIFEYSLAHLPFISSRQSTIINIMKEVDYVCYINISDFERAANAIVKFDSEYCKNESVFYSFNSKYNWENEKQKILKAFEN
ncbi:MAG TPA: hypothetical protein PKA78_01535 [Macellibacteroides fermentans]|uniref:hypothetical protein n=1 Tax=Macellibacteroides fermentans TaxID=879969 RepID=UPI002C4D078B|nr:hypothetical protein [Macellibacteroides fermentans]